MPTGSTRHNSTKKRHIETGTRLLRTSLEHYVCLTPGFKKNSYGEIQFRGNGSRSTYAPFFTCRADTTPQDVLQLLKEHWLLPLPKVVISVHGEFSKRDYSWKNVMNDSMIFTSGSSPAQQRLYNSSTIAIMDINSIHEKDSFYCKSNKGLFPAIYHANHKTKHVLKTLDPTHTHFIFVEGDSPVHVAEFRSRLLSHIASIPIEMDSNATSFVTIPIVSFLVSDGMDALITFSRDVAAGYPVVFSASADVVSNSLQEASQLNAELSENHVRRIRRTSEAIVISAEEKTNILNNLNKCALSEKKLKIYPTEKWNCIQIVFLDAIVDSGRYSNRSAFRLAMIWDCMDILKTLVYSSKQFKTDDDHMSVYLFVALMLDRAEFLEYLHELGINIYSRLTVQMLWTLYYESLYNDQYETETSFIVRRFVQTSIAKDGSDLLQWIGHFIDKLTKHEVLGLYRTREYAHGSCKREVVGVRKFSTAAATLHDDSPPVPYPDRDIFIWCILLGKTKLAKVFWRTTNHYAASALLASAVQRGMSELIDFNTQDSALADELHEASEMWTQTAIEFIAASFRERKQATLCLLTQRLNIYGGCSTLHLSYATQSAEFVAQPASQSALDYIWSGKTKKDQPGWKKFLAVLCPLLVPCLNVVDRTNYFVPAVSQVYQSTFTEGDDDYASEDKEAGLGAGVVYVMQRVSKSAADGAFELPTKQINKCASFSEDIFDYFNSPAIKFLVHSLFLFANMFILSLILVINAPPYFSLNNTNLLTFLVLFYMIGITVDEVRQIMTIENKPSIRRRFTSWVSDGWNQIDLVMVISFYTGKMFSLLEGDWAYIIKIFYSLSLLSMALRCFQVYLVFPFLGPKIYMMGRMLGDVRIFMSIMGLIFFSYGVILEGFRQELSTRNRESTNINTTGDFVVLLYNNIFREPYWQVYGNALGSAADPKYTFYTIVPGLVTAFYVLFANLLMVNLLIAMFSYTFQVVQENANLYWKFYRFEVVKEFWKRPWLPSPFIIIEDVVRTLQWFVTKGDGRNQAFNRPMTAEQEALLWDFEQEIQTLLTEKEKEEMEEADALHDDVKKILEKLKEKN